MHEIVVGLDLSVTAQAALAWAAEQARLTGQRVRAIHAMASPATYIATGGSAPLAVPFESVDDSYREAVKAVFAAVHPEKGWELQFMPNDAGPVLVAESRSASMLVIGTRVHTGLGRFLVGSVSHYCLSHAHCPVLAVPVEPVVTTRQSEASPSRATTADDTPLAVS
jgi:nucleotide-binding universal stress UspA family protein